MSKITVGIDVSKDQLDCATTQNKVGQFKNNESDIAKLIRWLREFDHIERIILEATGRYHCLCVSLLVLPKRPGC